MALFSEGFHVMQTSCLAASPACHFTESDTCYVIKDFEELLTGL